MRGLNGGLGGPKEELLCTRDRLSYSTSMQQVLMTACWTSLKEVALVVGALAQEVPLPTTSTATGRGLGRITTGGDGGLIDGGDEAMTDADAASVEDLPMVPDLPSGVVVGGGVVSVLQLGRMGSLLLSLLLKVKHSGAVEKAAMGLGALSGRLLR